jgi:phage terminase large subunit-like protein
MPLRPRSRLSAKQRADGDLRARAAIAFIEECCVHTIGKWDGQPFILVPWQREFIYDVFSNVDKRGRRLTRRAFLQIARKQGKSEAAAAVALYLLTADNEASPQIYNAAQDRDQASLVFDVAAQMVARSEPLRNICKVIPSTKRIICPENNGVIRAIASDAAGSHGFNASGIIFDEFHTQRSRDLYDVLSTSTSAREQPLIFMITTAGFDKNNGPCFEVYNYAKGVISGDIVDQSFVGRVYEVPPATSFETLAEQDENGDFVREKDLWTLANPSLVGMPGGFVRPDEMRRAVTEALHLPRARNHVLNLHFNVWTDASEAWLDSATWDANAGLGRIDADLEGREFYGALDLSHTQDFTAWCLLFPPEDEHGAFDVLWRFWIPEDAIIRRGDMAPTLREWERAGFVNVCPGDVVDHRDVEAQVLRDCETFHMREIAFDRFHAYPMVSSLQERFPEQLADVGQTYRFLNGPAKELERLLAEGRFHHGGNPVMRWMASHCVVETNQDDMIRPSRKRSADKIDGVLAACMALERAMANADDGEISFYIPGDDPTGTDG